MPPSRTLPVGGYHAPTPRRRGQRPLDLRGVAFEGVGGGPDQEDLLEEVLRSPYFHEDPGVLWRLLWCPPQVVRRLWEVLDQMNRYPGVDAGDFAITVRTRERGGV